jgi:hypothetical protein
MRPPAPTHSPAPQSCRQILEPSRFNGNIVINEGQDVSKRSEDSGIEAEVARVWFSQIRKRPGFAWRELLREYRVPDRGVVINDQNFPFD